MNPYLTTLAFYIVISSCPKVCSYKKACTTPPGECERLYESFDTSILVDVMD